jgi:deltex-like protein
VLSPGQWEAGTLDPVVFSELGEDDEEVVRLPCHSEATSCTMNRSTAERWFRTSNTCPVPGCGYLYPTLPGPQPSGVMKARMDPSRDCEGHAAGCGSIAVRYEFEGGVQLDQHPEPGKIYHGTKRDVYLPNDDEGSKALHLLKLAFERGVLFKVGVSVTTGKPGHGIVWNGIHQRTRRGGGAANHGYPDSTFLQRLQSECALVGVCLPDGAGGGAGEGTRVPVQRRPREDAISSRPAPPAV